MKILFFGLGSIGTRHATMLKGHELYAYRTGKEQNTLGIPEIRDLSQIDSIDPDVAFITNPTSEHVKYACMCAEKKISVFIEKPLSNSYEGVDLLRELVKKNKVSAYVAYVFRFHPAIRWLKKYVRKNMPLHVTVNCSSYLPAWGTNKNGSHLKKYSANRALGGGVILDLSHELDYLYYLFGDVKSVKGISGKLSAVTVDTEDFADILLNFKSGPVCNLHVNFMSQLKCRQIILDFESHSIVVDLINGSIDTIDTAGHRRRRWVDADLGHLYSLQTNYFLNQLGKEMMNDIDEAALVFNFIMRVKEAVI